MAAQDATSAELNGPIGVAVDSAGNLYIAENSRIRKVDASGTITTVAGNGTAGYNGDNIAATGAELNFPTDVAVDSAGNLYIADQNNSRIRKVANGPINFRQVNVGANSTQNVFLSINIALTLSAVQTSGDYSVLSNSCALNTPLSANTICTLQVQFTPTKPGQRWFPLVVTDSSSHQYSFGLEGTGVGPALAFTPGIITTVAGNGTGGYSGDNGPATSAELQYPTGVAVDSAGNLYMADYLNQRIRKVDATTSALSFSSLNVGQTSSAQSVALSDVGNAALNFSSLVVSSNFLLQGVGNDCVAGTPLAVGATCALGVAFAPTVAGNPLNGTLAVTDDAFNSPQTVNLSGTATQGAPTVSFTGAPASAVYGATFNVVATSKASTTVVIAASGACSITGNTVTMTSVTGACSLTADWAADANYSVASLSQSTTATKATSTTTITSHTPNPSLVGQAVAASFTVTGNGTATGNVTVSDGTGDTCTGTVAAGSCTLIGTTAGTKTLTASYGGDSNFQASTSSGLTQTVNPAATSTGVASSLNPSSYGQSVTFTTAVTSTAGVPAGTVTFKDGAATIGTATLNGSGQASFATTALSAGGHSITAAYAGNANFGTSTSSALSQSVGKAGTTTTLNSSPNPSTVGQTVNFVAIVTGQYGGFATGTVTFKQGANTVLGTASLVNGSATLPLSTLGTGPHTVTAVYGGDANSNGSTSTAITQNVVAKTATTTTLASSLNPSLVGQVVTFTATVTPSGSGTPTGTVTFKKGTTVLGTGTLSGGQATLSTSSLPAGSLSIVAVYGGDTQFATSTSANLTQTVSKATTTAVLSSAPNPSNVGQTVTFTVAVTSSAGIIPTGNVSFNEGGTTLGIATLDAAGNASFSTSTLSSGRHNIKAVYGGDASCVNSTSGTVQQVVR